MGSTNDRRVVELDLENAIFERNAKVSIDTLERLKEKLNLSDESGKGLNLDSLDKALGVLTSRFSVFGEFVAGIFGRLGEKVVDLGVQMGKSLTVEPIMDGFNEYELKMGNIQTILSNTRDKGTTIDDINKALDELNHYADLTVYSFADMTKAIGLFSTAGIGLEDSVSAIKGFSNLAAGMGANNANLARAEYQMSQMLQSGTMQLMDWKSMENAGMGGKYLQDALIQTAKELHGQEKEYAEVIKQLENHEISFRESIKSGNQSDSPNSKWLTAEIFLETMKKFANDPNLTEAATKIRTFSQLLDVVKEELGSGWGRSFEIIIGDFDAASELLTDVSQEIQTFFSNQSAARNKMLEEWSAGGGRNALIDSFKNIRDAIASVAKPIKEAFHDIIPPMTSKKLIELTNKFKDFTSKLKLSADQQDKLKNITSSLVSVLEKAFSVLGNLGSKAFSVLGNLGSVIGKIAEVLFGNNVFVKTSEEFKRVAKGEEILKNKMSEVLSPIEKLKTSITGIIGKLKEFTEALKNNTITKWADSVTNSVDKTKRGLTSVVDVMKNTVLGIFQKPIDTTALDTVKKKTEETANSVRQSFNNNFFDSIINSKIVQNIAGFFSYVGNTLWKGISQVGATIKSLLSNILNEIAGMNLSDVIKKVFDIFKLRRLWKSGNIIQAIADGFKNASGVFGKLPGILNKGLETLNDGIQNITNPLKKLGDMLDRYKEQDYSKILLRCAESIGIIAIALYGLSKIPAKSLATGIGGLIGVVGALLGTLKGFVTFTNGIEVAEISSAAMSLIKIAVAVNVLSIAFTSIGKMTSTGVIKGVYGIGFLLTGFLAVTWYLNAMPIPEGMTTKVLGMIGLSIALGNFVKQVKILAMLPAPSTLVGIGSLGLILTEMLGALEMIKLINLDQNNLTSIATLIVLAMTMNKLAKVVAGLSKIDWTQLARGLVGMGGLLAELLLFIRLINWGNYANGSINNISLAIDLMVLGESLKSFSSVIREIGLIPFRATIKGLIGIGGGLGIIALAMRAMPKDINMIGLGLVATSFGLKIMADAMSKLGQLKSDEIGRSITALAGSMAVLMIAMNGMTGTLAGAAAMMLMSVALAAFVPVLAALGNLPIPVIAIGLGALAAAFLVVGGAAALLSPLAPVIDAFGAALLILGGAVFLAGAGCLAFATAISELALIGAAGVAGIIEVFKALVSFVPEIVKAVQECFIGLCEAIIQNAPLVQQAIFVGLQAIANFFVQNIPMLVESIMLLITSLVKTLSEHVPEFIEAGSNYVIGILKGLTAKVPDIVVAAYQLIVAFLQGIAKGVPILIQGGIDIGIAFIEGISAALRNNRERFVKAVRELCSEGLKTVLAFFGIHSPSTVMADVGKNIDEGLVVGINGNNDDVKKAFEQLGDTGLSGLDSIGISATEKGNEILNQYISGINQNADGVTDSSSAIGQDALDALSSYSENASVKGLDFSKAFGDGLSDGSGNVFNSADILGKSGLDGLNGLMDEYNLKGMGLSSNAIEGFNSKSQNAHDAGNDFGKSLENGLEQEDGSIEKQGKKYGDHLMTGLKEKHRESVDEGRVLGSKIVNGVGSERVIRDMKKVGRHLVDGLIKGIESDYKIKELEDASTKIADKVLSTTKKKLEVASPSKAMERIGMYADEGLANGIKRFSNRIFDSADNVNNDLLTTFASIMGAVSQVINENMDLNPIIRPVVDFSNVEKNAGFINSIWGSESFKMANANEASIAMEREFNAINNQNLSINDSGIISAIDKLRSDMSVMTERMNNLQIVMDSGALVGQLASPIDSALGMRTFRNWREREA